MPLPAPSCLRTTGSHGDVGYHVYAVDLIRLDNKYAPLRT